MSLILRTTFVAPLTLPPSHRRGIHFKPYTTCSLANVPNIVTTAPSQPQPQLSSTSPQRSHQLIRKALFTLIAAATTFLPTRSRPATAASHHHSNSTTIARAVPKSFTLNNTARKHKNTAKSSSYDPHASGTPFAIAATSAFIASAIAVAVTHPIDTIKTMRQARATGTKTGSITLHSLYRGVSSNIVKEAPNAAIYLAMYEVFKGGLLKFAMFANAPLLAMCVAGMLGDAVGSVVRVPAEIVNKRLQLGLSNGWHDAVKEAFLSENGVEATFASWLAVLWRDVPYGGLQIGGYEFVRLVLAGWGMQGLGYSVVAGAIAGLFAAVITTPADVLVTRMSTQSPQCYLETRHYMSPSATFRRIIRDEGFGALWTGALARGLFYMPMIGLFFAVYETFKFGLMNPYTARTIGLSCVGLALTGLLSGYRYLMRAVGAPMQVGMLAVGSMVFRRRKGKKEASVKW